MSGQVVMQGFIHRQIPIFARRAITMIPALVVIGVGFSPTRALVLSQVFLSFGIPFALIPLLFFTSSRSLMGSLVNRRCTVLAGLVTALIVGSTSSDLPAVLAQLKHVRAGVIVGQRLPPVHDGVICPYESDLARLPPPPPRGGACRPGAARPVRDQ